MQLHVLPLQWPDLGYRYTVSEVWPILVQADLSQAPLVFGAADIQTYDWSNQELWLTDASLERMQHTNTAALLQEAVGRAFVVTLEGERLYGGLFYFEYGAAAIRFPVIHVLGPSNRVLRIRPALGHGWTPEDPLVAAQCRAIADPRLAVWLRARHLVSDTVPSERPADVP